MFDEMRTNAQSFGYVIEGKENLCLSLLTAAVLGDDVATLQLGDILEEAGVTPLPQFSSMADQMVACLKGTRKTYKNRSADRKKQFRDGARAAGVYSLRRKSK